MRTAVVLACIVGACGGPAAPVYPQGTLVSPGATPRRVLRLSPPRDASEHVELTLKHRMRTVTENTTLDESTQMTDLPTVQLACSLAATAVSPTGDAELALTVDAYRILDDVIDESTRSATATVYDSMPGKRITWTRAASGRDSALVGAIESLGSAVRDLGVWFPDEPIGIGAVWTESTALEQGGATWTRAATYTLRDLDELSATVDVDVELRTGERVIRVEPKATTRITGGTGRVSAHVVMPLSGLAPRATAQSTFEVRVLVVQGHLRIASTVTTEQTLGVRPLGAPSP